MTLIEKINARYVGAISEIERIKTAPPETPQQHYDLKKAIAKGHQPTKQVKKLDAFIAELRSERIAILKGVQEVKELVVASNEIPSDIKEIIIRRIGKDEYL